jgi:hypothetical protein
VHAAGPGHRQVQPDHHQQDAHRADEGVDEELDGGVLAPGAAPDADEEVHGQQHELEEQEEQEEVQRHETAHHAGAQQQVQRRVAFYPPPDGVRGDGSGKQHQGRQQHQRHAQPIHAHEVIDGQLAQPAHAQGDPVEPFGVGQRIGVRNARPLRVQLPEQVGGQPQLPAGDQVQNRFEHAGPGSGRNPQNDGKGNQRQEYQQGEEMLRHWKIKIGVRVGREPENVLIGPQARTRRAILNNLCGSNNCFSTPAPPTATPASSSCALG